MFFLLSFIDINILKYVKVRACELKIKKKKQNLTSQTVETSSKLKILNWNCSIVVIMAKMLTTANNVIRHLLTLFPLSLVFM